MHNLTEEGEYGRAGDIDPDSSDEYSDGEAQSDLAYSVVSARRHAVSITNIVSLRITYKFMVIQT